MTDMGSLHWKSRALAAEADCKRLQDEAANLDAARREAEAAAAEMREALTGLLDACEAVDGAHGCQVVDPHAEDDARAALASPTPGAALLAEREEMRKALEPFAGVGQWLFARPDVPDSQPAVSFDGINGYRITLTRGHFKAAHLAINQGARAALKETSNG